MNFLQKTAQTLGELKAAYDAPLLAKSLELRVDDIGRMMPMQLLGGSLSWLGGSWADKMRGQVWRVANFYATTGAQVPLALYKPGKNGKAERVMEHPVLDLLYQPNPDSGAFLFFYAVLLQLRSAGNCFVSTVVPEFGPPDKKGKPGELWILPLRHVVPLIAGKPATGQPMRPVEAYRYTPDLSKPNQYQDLDRKQVLHLKQYNPDGGVWGLGCIAAAEKEITGDDSSISAQVELLQNRGPRGAAWLEPVNNMPVDRDPSIVRALKAVLNNTTGRVSRADVPLLTNKLGWTAFGISAVDLDILNFRRANFSDLCSYYGVPSLLLNDKEGTTFANLEAARKMLYSQALLPVLGYLASELSRWLVPQFDRTMWLEPDTSGIPELQEDIAAKVAWLKDAWWIPVKRKQEMCGETPSWDGPTYVVPSSYMDYADLTAEPVDAGDTEPGEDDVTS
jgi:HK97 family phage portal protein